MEKGMAQSFSGCEAIADVENEQVAYAVVTNYIECFFMKNTDDRIYRDVSSLRIDRDVPQFASVVMIAGKLHSLLLGA
jgi:hypothetical protein